MEGYGSGNGLWGEAFQQYISSDGKQLPAEIKKKVFTKMSEYEFKDWLRKHGVSDPNLNIGIGAWALPILLDYAINEAMPETGEQIDANSDAISRRAAILAIRTRQWLTEGAKDVLVYQINQLPPFEAGDKQTKQQTDFANQLITKQAAIDALGDEPIVWGESELDDYDLGRKTMWDENKDALEALLPAQLTDEPTHEAIELYCHRRCLTIITNEMLNQIKAEYNKSAQPHQRWIPVTERLPEEHKDILVTVKDSDEPWIAAVNYAKGTWWDAVFDRALNPLEVLAWRELPEPYAERRQDDVR